MSGTGYSYCMDGKQFQVTEENGKTTVLEVGPCPISIGDIKVDDVISPIDSGNGISSFFKSNNMVSILVIVGILAAIWFLLRKKS